MNANPLPSSPVPLRVRELKEVRAADLDEHPLNWRVHPASQRQAVLDLLNEIGIADALLAYPSQRNGGRLTLIDGHLRKDLDPEQVWPVLVLDLDDEEADLLLATNDPLRQLAVADQQALAELRAGIEKVSAHIAAFADALLKTARPVDDSEEIPPLEDDTKLWPEISLLVKQSTASEFFELIHMFDEQTLHEGITAMLAAVDVSCLERAGASDDT